MTTILKLDDAIPDYLCDACIDYYEHAETYNLNELNSNNVSGFGTYENTIDHRLVHDIHEAFTKVMMEYLKMVPTFKSNGCTGYQIRKIHGPTLYHWDDVFGGSNHHPRNLSVIAALNSDFEEGVFNFPQQKYKTRLLRGQAIAFPVYFTHPHEVSKPEGYRYTINTWATEQPRPFIPHGTHET
tara:strand:+ start:221 stop:772 length:552 start_codon:yes stop_codon:yes gene_type:complete